MVKKLPSHVALRWNRVVDEWLAEDVPEKYDFVSRSRNRAAKTGYLPFAEFCEFMRKQARIACNPVTSLQALKTEETKEKNEGRRTKPPFQDKNKGRCHCILKGDIKCRRGTQSRYRR